MKKFKQIIIQGPHNALSSFMTDIRQHRNARFEYSHEMSNRYAEDIQLGTDSVVCMKTEDETLSQCSVFLKCNGESITVTNVTPRNQAGLSKEQYNRIMDAFCQEVVRPLLTGALRLDEQGMEEEVSMEQIIGRECYQSLHNWATVCNRACPIAHENDSKRWNLFICSAYQHNISMDKDIFTDWLIEDMGWGNDCLDNIDKLYSLYEFGISLLRSYNRHEEL